MVLTADQTLGNITVKLKSLLVKDASLIKSYAQNSIELFICIKSFKNKFE